MPAVLRKPPAASTYFTIENGRRDLDPKGFTKFPHQYMTLLKRDRHGRRKLMDGHVQRDLLYVIGLKTVGAEARPEWAHISIRELADMCDVSVSSVKTALDDLEARHIIAARDRSGCAQTTGKMYKWTPAHWEKAKPYQKPVKAELIELAKAVENAWSEGAKPEISAEDAWAAKSEGEDSPTIIEANGNATAETPLQIATAPDSPAVHVRIVYHSGFDVPVALSASARRGRVHVTARPWTGSCTGQPVQKFAVSSPVLPSAESEKYRRELPQLILHLWNTAKDEAFIGAIVAAANGAPWEDFLSQLRLKFGDRFERATKHQPGLLRNLAAQAAAAHRLRQSLTPVEPALRSTVETHSKPASVLNPSLRWDKARAALQAQLTPQQYANWIEPTRQLKETPEWTVIAVEDQPTADFLQQEFDAIIADTLRQLGEPTKVTYRVETIR